MKVVLKNGQIVDLRITTEGDEYALVDEKGTIIARLTKEDDTAPFVVTTEDRKKFSESDDELASLLDLLNRGFQMDLFSGIEDSEDEDSSFEGDPFDPREISIDQKKVAMDTILRRFEQGTLCLNPNFQRKELWKDDRKSRLIESLLLKIPIPMFYVSSDEDGNWTVVDGLQRLSTIRDFVLGKAYLADKSHDPKKKGDGLKLTGLEFWHDFEGYTMKKLPVYLYNRLSETEFSFTIINPGTQEEVKRNIFKRINTGGIPLSSQEIRNALYGGKSTELLNKLAEMKIFKEATGRSIKTDRMEDKELVLRFVSFLLRRYTTYDKAVTTDEWLSDTMILLNAFPDLNTREARKLITRKKIQVSQIKIMSEEEITVIFEKTMHRAKQLFGMSAFRKSVPGHRRTPINKSLFETWGVLLSDMSEDEFLRLMAHKKAMFEEYERLLHDPKFVVAISRDSTRVSSVTYRYFEVKKLINQYSHD